MGRFGGMTKARTAGTGGNYFTNGLHLVRIDRIKSFEDGKRVQRTAIEFTVLKTIVPGDDDEQHKPGSEVSKLWDERGIWFESQFKQFVRCVLDMQDLDEDDFNEKVTEEDYEALADEKTQPLSGTLITVFGRPHRTESGGLITVSDFKNLVQPHEALEKMGGDLDALRAAYRESSGFKSLADFNKKAAESAKEAGTKWETVE